VIPARQHYGRVGEPEVRIRLPPVKSPLQTCFEQPKSSAPARRASASLKLLALVAKNGLNRVA
jgi:hypothetical protein